MANNMETMYLFEDVTNLLKDHGLTYKWLLARLNEVGFTTGKVSMSKWVHGCQVTAKAREAHELSLKIIDFYTQSFVERLGEIK